MQLIRALRPRGFARANRGVAMIEFAIGTPVLLTVTLCGLETSNLVLANMRMSRIASMTADNASRVRDTIDEADINELMSGAQLASGTYDLASNGAVILSALQVNQAGNGQEIAWQRCFGLASAATASSSPTSYMGSSYGAAGKGASDASLQAMGPPGRQIAAAAGTSVMFVEVRYNYKPLLDKWGSARTISYVSAFNVRKRNNGDPTNVNQYSPAQKASC